MKDKLDKFLKDYPLFAGFLWLVGIAIAVSIIGIVVGHSVGSYDRQYRTFEDYQYQQYLNR